MNRLKNLRPDILLAAGFLILPLLLYWQVTVGPRTMLPADNLFQWLPWATAASELGVEIPQNGLLSDLIIENYAWKRFVVDSLQAREIPLWNPFTFAGTPFLANGQHSAYYPFSALFLVVPLAKAYGWFTLSQIWLAGALMYAFARVLRLRRASAAVAGLIYQGCGFILVSAAVFPMILAAAVWLPLLLACIEMIIRRTTAPDGGGKTLPWAALGSIALGFQILAGHIEITYYTLLVMALFALWRLVAVSLRARRQAGTALAASSTITLPGLALKPTAWLLGFVLIGLMLGAIQLVPFLEVGQANFREGAASLAEIRSWAFPTRRVITLLLPDFFGNPADHEFLDVFRWRFTPFEANYSGQLNPHGAYSSTWGIKNYVEGGIYLGILPLLLAALGIWSALKSKTDSRRTVWFFAGLAALSISFVFGTITYALLYYGLPGINQLHSPFRWVFPFSLSIAVLAGFGMDYLADSRASSSIAPVQRPSEQFSSAGLRSVFRLSAGPTTTAALAGVVFWAGMLLLAALIFSRLFYPGLEPVFERIFLGLAQAQDAFPDTAAFYSYLFFQLFWLGMMLAAAGIVLRLSTGRARLLHQPLWLWAAFAVIGLDLLIAGYGFNAATDPALLEHKPALIEWLEQQPGHWRLTTFAPHGDKPLNANTPWLYGFQDVRGYDSVILKSYTDYMGAIEPQGELPFNRVQPVTDWEALNSPLLDVLGVKYVVTAETVNLPKYREVWQAEGLRVYENLAVMPRAYVLPATATLLADEPLEAMQSHDPREFAVLEPASWTARQIAQGQRGEPLPAQLVTYGNIEVNVRAEAREASWLILNDVYFRGWDVFARPVAGGTDGDIVESELELVPVNGIFRGVLLEPGTWEVRFRYSPLSFKLGGLTSFMGGVIVIFALTVWAWRRFYNPQIELTNTRSIAKNSLAPMTLNLFNRVIDFAFAAFYLRVLGPADAGKYATAIILAGWFEIISNFGLNTLVIREVSKDKSQASRYLLNTTILRIGTGLVGSLPVFLYVVGVRAAGNPLDQGTTAAILLLMVGMVFSGMAQGLAGLYYAYEAAEVNAAITTVTTILKVGFGVVALLLGYGFVGLAGVSILTNIITLLILTAGALRQFSLRGPWTIDARLQKSMVKTSYPLMLNHLFAVVFFQVDVPLLRHFNGDAVVGWYNSAYKWVNAINVVPSFFTFALFPVISRQVQSSLADARRTFRLSVKLLVLMALPIAAITTLLAPLFISMLGGQEFLPHGAVALQLVIWSIPIGWINSVTNYMLIALGLEKRLTTAFILGVGFNLVANLILVPRFSYLAASVTTIASEIVLLALFATYLRTAIPGPGWVRLLTRPLAATAAMLWMIWLGSQVHMALGLALGIMTYAAGLWLLRVFGEEERRILLTLMPANISGRLRLTRSEAGD